MRYDFQEMMRYLVAVIADIIEPRQAMRLQREIFEMNTFLSLPFRSAYAFAFSHFFFSCFATFRRAL